MLRSCVACINLRAGLFYAEILYPFVRLSFLSLLVLFGDWLKGGAASLYETSTCTPQQLFVLEYKPVKRKYSGCFETRNKVQLLLFSEFYRHRGTFLWDLYPFCLCPCKNYPFNSPIFKGKNSSSSTKPLKYSFLVTKHPLHSCSMGYNPPSTTPPDPRHSIALTLSRAKTPATSTWCRNNLYVKNYEWTKAFISWTCSSD